MSRLGGTILESSCFDDPTWIAFGGFASKECWSALEGLGSDYYGLFAGKFNQCDLLDTASCLYRSPDAGFQALREPGCAGAAHPG